MELRNTNFKEIFIGFLLATLLMSSNALAEFFGPLIVVEGKIGDAPDEFFVEYDDMGPAAPWIRAVNLKGNIFLKDNNGIRVFNQKGNILNTIRPKDITNVEGWPAFMDVDSQGNIYTSNYDNKLQKYNIKGEILWEKDVVVGDMRVQNDDSIFLWGYRLDQKDKENNLHYSSTGQLLKTYDIKPLELGVVNEQSLGSGKYITTIQYPDITYTTDRITYHNYIRGCDRVLYATLYKNIVKYNSDGKLMAELVMPETEYKILRPAGGGFNEIKELIVEYGDPVLAPNGDVYTWKRTPDKYSILKWVCVDGPECPQNLEVNPTTKSLKFTWQKPLKDAEKVSYYQLLQSYNICGPFRQTALLKNNQLSYEDRDVKKGETYYYVVKAVRGKDYSGNSNKVCGQIE